MRETKKDLEKRAADLERAAQAAEERARFWAEVATAERRRADLAEMREDLETLEKAS